MNARPARAIPASGTAGATDGVAAGEGVSANQRGGWRRRARHMGSLPEVRCPSYRRHGPFWLKILDLTERTVAQGPCRPIDTPGISPVDRLLIHMPQHYRAIRTPEDCHDQLRGRQCRPSRSRIYTGALFPRYLRCCCSPCHRPRLQTAPRGGVRCRALLPHGGAMTGAVMNRRYRSPCRREFLAGTAGSALHWEKNRLRLRPQGPAAGPHIGGRIS